jgi:acetoin utilization protein AcuB
MLMPPISRYMTAQPWTIERSATLGDARQLMLKHDIRHLPVFDSGRLVGVVSDRDLRLLEAVGGSDTQTKQVGAAMTDKPFVVTGDTAVDEIVQIMSEHKYGSVIVMGRHGIEGVFTTVDACRVLADVLQRTVE